MRTIEQISNDIDALNLQKRTIDEQLYQLRKERIVYWNNRYENRHNVKRGDILTFRTLGGVRLVYDSIRVYGGILYNDIVLRRLKKDGTPSRNTTTLPVKYLNEATVVGHVDIPEKQLTTPPPAPTGQATALPL